MEAPPEPAPDNPQGDAGGRRPSRRRCSACGDLFGKEDLVDTRRGWMCTSDFYMTGTDNEDSEDP